MEMKLFLIEDEVDDAEKILRVSKGWKQIRRGEDGEEWNFEVTHIRGTSEKTVRERKYFFYSEEPVLGSLHEKIDAAMEAECAVGILLDTVLDQKELDSRNTDYYPKVELAKKIYSEFQQEIPIFIITSVGNFYTKSEEIMGLDLSDRFILKDALTERQMEGMIREMLLFFIREWEEKHG